MKRINLQTKAFLICLTILVTVFVFMLFTHGFKTF